LSGIIRGAAGGLLYHYGGQITGRYLGRLGNSLVWIAGPTAEQQIEPRLTGDEAPALGQSLGENIPIGLFAGMGGARRRGPATRQTVPEVMQETLRGSEQVRVRVNDVERIALRRDLPKILTKQIEVVPPKEVWEELGGLTEGQKTQPRFRIEGNKLVDAFDEVTAPKPKAEAAESESLVQPQEGLVEMNVGLNPAQAVREADRMDLGPADLVRRGAYCRDHSGCCRRNAYWLLPRRAETKRLQYLA
jgi:hypothetical protein